MVSTYPMQPFYRPAQLSVDTSGHIPQKYFEEDDSILDDAVLDQSAIDSGLEMSPPMVDSRRDSFALGSSLFSPKQEDWQSVDMQSLSAGNPFAADQHSTNPFLRMDQQQSQQQHRQHQNPHQHAMGAHIGSWPMTASTSANSGVATPIAHFDGLPAEFDPATNIFHRGSMSAPFTGMHGLFSSVHGMPVSAAATTAGTAPVATTSASSVPMQVSTSSTSIASQPAMAKKIPPQSPLLRSHNDLRRGDGIRKKNARFDIPAERNLNNIDQLIAQSTDEQEIKELKQQKRLLRNRQAALDSRQRKKLHTERLEDEKKQYVSHVNDLEQGIERLKLQVSELLHIKQTSDEHIEMLNMEKEEMIRQHTIETAELRKKVAVLSNHVQVLEGAAAGVMPNHAPVFAGATTGAFGNMEGLSMDGAATSWDQMFPEMAGAEQHHQQQAANGKSDMQLIPAPRKANNEVVDSEKPGSQGGLLFMLFLVGAFVLSSRQTPSIPRVSEDVRVASAALLENVLKDAGVSDVSTAAAASSAAVNAPTATGTSWTQPAGQNLAVEPSMLTQLSDELMQPTEEQTNEQLFSLTAAQYEGVVNYQHPHNADRAGAGVPAPASQGRRNLAEALAAMRGSGKAEVYTRSLLWDQIPSDVVRTFAKMVSEANTASPGSDGAQ